MSTRGGPPGCWCVWKSCTEECLKDKSSSFPHGREMDFTLVTPQCGPADHGWKLQGDRQTAQFTTKAKNFPTVRTIYRWVNSLSK